MKHIISSALLLITGILTKVNAQQLFTNTSVQKAYAKETRSITGKPGKKYWQNNGDYSIQVTFDPSSQLLTGEETIQYTNNSSDSLKKLVIRLYPDFYKKGVSRTSSIADKDQGEGVIIEECTVGSEKFSAFNNKKAFHQNTNLILTPAQPLLPKTNTTFHFKWHYKVNTGSPVRTGMIDPQSYFIAYFFPRLAVYDDIDGWDDWSYNGIQEFYNDFGNFDVTITVPVNYVVWATGERQSPQDNFSTEVLQKIQQAQHSDGIVHVIDSATLAANKVFAANPVNAWKFKAHDVSDFAFALSSHYLWDASSVLADSVSKRRVLVSAVYNPIHRDYYDVANQAHQSVFYMSHYYPKVAFPFPQITVVDGTDQMEYPMMVNDNPTESHKDAVQLTSHEIFHSYFPFYMGINETQYAWMDEGWATIGESVISPKMGEPEDEGIYSRGRYEKISGTNKDLPLISNTKLYQDGAYLSNSYGKGGLCYWVLQDMLGDALYFKALHRYMEDWHGKHPVPYDFFNSFNAATDKNLNWFWQKWFYDWVYPDLAISNVAVKAGQNLINISNKGGLPVPIYLTITFDDGTQQFLHYGADCWKEGNKDFLVKTPFKRLIKSILLGNENTPDKFHDDNRWPLK